RKDADCAEAVKRERMKHLGTRRKWHVTANLSLSSSKRTGSAAVSTPRPTCSRVTTADGRSPGLRVTVLYRLPGTRGSQWHVDGGLTAHSCGGSCGFETGHSHSIPSSSLAGTVDGTVFAEFTSCHSALRVRSRVFASRSCRCSTGGFTLIGG